MLKCDPTQLKTGQVNRTTFSVIFLKKIHPNPSKNDKDMFFARPRSGLSSRARRAIARVTLLAAFNFRSHFEGLNVLLPS